MRRKNQAFVNKKDDFSTPSEDSATGFEIETRFVTSSVCEMDPVEIIPPPSLPSHLNRHALTIGPSTAGRRRPSPKAQLGHRSADYSPTTTSQLLSAPSTPTLRLWQTVVSRQQQVLLPPPGVAASVAIPSRCRRGVGPLSCRRRQRRKKASFRCTPTNRGAPCRAETCKGS